jgi:hypothetical protein
MANRASPKIDRAAVMRRAHADYRWWKRAGAPKPFADCLKGAWAAARMARRIGSTKFKIAA